jgi:hypothetical protein
MENIPKKIYQQIPKVMADVGAIGKNGDNKFDNYKFRTIDDLYSHLQPALHKNGVFFVPQVLDSKEDKFESSKGTPQIRVKVRVKYTIYADDGSSIETIVDGENIDRSDKATNKALTAALKYMLIQVFCIAVKDIEDGDSESPEIPKQKEKEKPKEPAIPSASKNDVVKIMKAFQGLAVSESQVLSFLNKRIDNLTNEDLTYLKNIGNKIKSGEAKAEAYFKKGV